MVFCLVSPTEQKGENMYLFKKGAIFQEDYIPIRLEENRLIRDNIPNHMWVRGRKYELVSFLEKLEPYVDGYIMAQRLRAKNGDLPESEGRHIMKYQEDILPILQKITFIFLGWWRDNGGSGDYYRAKWGGREWHCFPDGLCGCNFDGHYWGLRRVV